MRSFHRDMWPRRCHCRPGGPPPAPPHPLRALLPQLAGSTAFLASDAHRRSRPRSSHFPLRPWKWPRIPCSSTTERRRSRSRRRGRRGMQRTGEVRSVADAVEEDKDRRLNQEGAKTRGEHGQGNAPSAAIAMRGTLPN
jgi:hypothetical protein